MEYTQTQLQLPLMETIKDLGGKAKTKEIYNALANKLQVDSAVRKQKLTLSSTNRTYNRWERTVRWVKQNLHESGLIISSSKGIWELTEKADAFLKNAKPGIVITLYEVYDEKNDLRGIALWGDISSAQGIIENGSVNLILTSPPYPLLAQKEYRNKSEDEYIEWFLPIAQQFYNSLSDDGSLVLNLGPTFKRGLPVKSLYMYELVLMLCKKIGFHLSQEFYWHNPAKMPTACWVTVEKIRVKESVENIFWLSKTPYPKANNKNILEPYSEQYKKIVDSGSSKSEVRPSGHKIKYFGKDNGGKIPSNLIVASNTASNGSYFKYCRENNLPIHPARFPAQLPEYFIKLLTAENDLVWDAFSGSNVTGEVCFELNRRFIATEKSLTYLKGSIGRFDPKHLRINDCLYSA